MTKLSRPFQLALVAAGLLVAVWFVALRGHSSGGASTTPVLAPKAPATATSAGAPSPVYHGAAPGLEGLTRDIAKAHGAVAESERYARRLEEKSSQATSGTAEAPSAQRPGRGRPHPRRQPPPAARARRLRRAPARPPGGRPRVLFAGRRLERRSPHRRERAAHHASPRSPAPHRPHDHAHDRADADLQAPADRRARAHRRHPLGEPAQREAAVEAQLKRGDTVVLLFWTPRAPRTATTAGSSGRSGRRTPTCTWRWRTKSSPSARSRGR